MSQAESQTGKLIASTLGENFDAAIRVVANPPSYTEYVRLALHKPTETDALHTSADQEAAALKRFFSRTHAQPS